MNDLDLCLEVVQGHATHANHSVVNSSNQDYLSLYL